MNRPTETIDIEAIRARASSSVTEIVASPREYARVQQILRDRADLLAAYDALHDFYQDNTCYAILEDKALVSAVIVAVMSCKQSERDDAVRKLQKHILAVEAERDAREAECERWAKGNADLARIVAGLTDPLHGNSSEVIVP